MLKIWKYVRNKIIIWILKCLFFSNSKLNYNGRLENLSVVEKCYLRTEWIENIKSVIKQKIFSFMYFTIIILNAFWLPLFYTVRASCPNNHVKCDVPVQERCLQYKLSQALRFFNHPISFRGFHRLLLVWQPLLDVLNARRH